MRLIVVASGHCVWEDLRDLYPDIANLQKLPDDVMCVNDMIMHFPFQFEHAYSNDIQWLPKWLNARRPRYVKDQQRPRAHCRKDRHSAFEGWDVPGHGTSSLNAVYVGIALGYTEIICCGVPLDDNGHYFDPPWVKTNFQNEVSGTNGQLRFWEQKRFKDAKVYSMSGRTRELLGAPPGTPDRRTKWVIGDSGDHSQPRVLGRTL